MSDVMNWTRRFADLLGCDSSQIKILRTFQSSGWRVRVVDVRTFDLLVDYFPEETSMTTIREFIPIFCKLRALCHEFWDEGPYVEAVYKASGRRKTTRD